MIVTEQDVPSPKSASADVTVTITDANDNDPEFPASGYDVSVAEGDGRREIGKVEATDADSGSNSEVRYSLVSVSEGGQGRFEVNAETGSVFAKQRLQRHETFLLRIEAEDQATPEALRRCAQRDVTRPLHQVY